MSHQDSNAAYHHHVASFDEATETSIDSPSSDPESPLTDANSPTVDPPSSPIDLDSLQSPNIPDHPCFSSLPRSDRYGWRSSQISDPVDDHELHLRRRDSAEELDRETKWIKVILTWCDFVSKTPDTLNKWVMQGIPDGLRSRVWQLILDPKFDEDRKKRTPLAELAAKGEGPGSNTIEIDLRRTLTKLVIFSDPTKLESLRLMLLAYSNIDPECGYVQGMSCTAALLLSYLDEERAFWCFFRLMSGKRFHYRHLFINKFAGLMALNRVWEELITSKFPKVAANLIELSLLPALYTSSWFLTGFLNMKFHPELKMRIFERFIVFGCRSFLSFGITIVAMNKDQLEKGKLSECATILQQPEKLTTMADWRVIRDNFDRLFLSVKQYQKALAKADH
jgi:hypothetical protein